MAEYFYQLEEQERGPVSFRELVKMVRDEVLFVDDPVRADWEKEWHPAATVVGLFHMAGREDVLAKWEAERRKAEQQRIAAESRSDVGVDDLEAMLQMAEQVAEQTWTDPSLQDLNDPESRARWRAEKAEREQQAATSGISDVISEAVAESELKDSQREKNRLWADLFSQQSLKFVLRLGCGFAVANLVAWGIMNWTHQEQMRYPDRRSKVEHVFPFYGSCSPGEYYFLMFDAMIFGGFVGYGGALVLESMSDD